MYIAQRASDKHFKVERLQCIVVGSLGAGCQADCLYPRRAEAASLMAGHFSQVLLLYSGELLDSYNYSPNCIVSGGEGCLCY